LHSVGSVIEWVKAPFLWRPCDHNRDEGSTPTLSLLGGFEQAANSEVRSQRNNRKTRKWTTPKRVWIIRPNYNATVAFSWQEDKDGTKQTNNKTIHENVWAQRQETSQNRELL